MKSTATCVDAPGVNTSATPRRLSSSTSSSGIVPPTVTINRGTRVTWVWHSFGIRHNVTVKSGPSKFHSRQLQSSGSYSHLFNKKGTYHLYCTLHPTQMKETIIVR